MALKIISGGQSGVDRVALEVARSVGLETGGYAPLGWKTEDGPRPDLAEFGLRECDSPEYGVRTSLNVEHSDATVWFGRTATPGYLATLRAINYHTRPFLVNPSAHKLAYFVWKHDVRILNVAGNRLSTHPLSAITARQTLQIALTSPVLP